MYVHNTLVTTLLLFVAVGNEPHQGAALWLAHILGAADAAES
jgi:hypothetical protein